MTKLKSEKDSTTVVHMNEIKVSNEDDSSQSSIGQ